MKEVDEWFEAYAVSHQNRTNKIIHWVCVPLIYWSVLALLWTIPVPEIFSEAGLNWTYLALMLALAWYTFLAPPLAVGMLIVSYALIALTRNLDASLEQAGSPSLWAVALGVFAMAWIGQFIGHKIEGKKPSFLTDLSFLLIGPFWLLHFIYRKAGIRYK